MLLVSYPERGSVLESLKELLELIVIVCVQVEFKHVKDDDNINLIEQGENDGAQQVQNGVLIADLKIAQDGACIICDPKDEHDDGLNKILHHGRRSINNQLKFDILELFPLSFILLILHKSPSFAFILILFNSVTLHHMFKKPSFNLLILLVNWNLFERQIIVSLNHLFLQEIYLYQLLVYQYFVIVENSYVSLTFLLLIVFLIIENFGKKFINFFIFLFNIILDALLQLRQISDLDDRYAHVNQISQNEVIKVNCSHSGKIRQNSKSKLQRNAWQFIIKDGISHLLADHLEDLQEGNDEPYVFTEHTRKGEINEVNREKHVSQGHKHEFSTIPFLRLELSTQNLISLVLLFLSLFANQVI